MGWDAGGGVFVVLAPLAQRRQSCVRLVQAVQVLVALMLDMAIHTNIAACTRTRAPFEKPAIRICNEHALSSVQGGDQRIHSQTGRSHGSNSHRTSAGDWNSASECALLLARFTHTAVAA